MGQGAPVRVHGSGCTGQGARVTGYVAAAGSANEWFNARLYARFNDRYTAGFSTSFNTGYSNGADAFFGDSFDAPGTLFGNSFGDSFVNPVRGPFT